MANIKHAAVARSAPFSAIIARVEAIDWAQVTADLDGQGAAVLKGLLSPEQCRALAALYPDDARFRWTAGGFYFHENEKVGLFSLADKGVF